MTAVVQPRAGAPSGREVDWQAIAWREIRHNVYRLQLRIAKAVKEGRWGKGKERPLGIPVMQDRAMQALHALLKSLLLTYTQSKATI